MARNGGSTRQARRHGRTEAGGTSGRWAWLRSKLSLGAIGWILVLGYVGYMMWPQAAALVGVGGGGDPAPSFRVATLDGQVVSLDDYRGDVVLVNFWATWCPPCRFEMPGFQDVYESRKDQGFHVVGISMDQTGPSGVRAFLDQKGITYPVGMVNSEVFNAFNGPRTLPASFLIDRRGRIRHQVTGVFAEVALAQAVDRLLAERVPGGLGMR